MMEIGNHSLEDKRRNSLPSFRSIQNWFEDLYWKQLDLNYPDAPDAVVHHGFYYAYHNTTLRAGVVNAVKRAKKTFGEINLFVIGHSMGGAMAAICALDLTGKKQQLNFLLKLYQNYFKAVIFVEAGPNRDDLLEETSEEGSRGYSCILAD